MKLWFDARAVEVGAADRSGTHGAAGPPVDGRLGARRKDEGDDGEQRGNDRAADAPCAVR